MKQGTWETIGWAATGTVFGLLAAMAGLPYLVPGLSTTILDNTAYWLLARVSGVAAYILMWLSVVFGLLLTGRVAKRWPGMRTANALHKDISLLALGYTLFHALILLGDHYIGFNLVSLLIPFTSPYEPAAVGLGQVAALLTGLVVLSFYFRRRIGGKTWRLLHYLTFLMYLLSLFHGLLAGTDSQAGWAFWMYAATGVVTYALTIYRLLTRTRFETEKEYGPGNRKRKQATASGGG